LLDAFKKYNYLFTFLKTRTKRDFYWTARIINYNTSLSLFPAAEPPKKKKKGQLRVKE